MPPLFLRRVPPGLPAALGDRGRRARCTQRPRLLSALGPAAGRGAISLPTVLCPELGAWLELSAHGAQRCVPSARPVTVTFRWPGDSWRSPGVRAWRPGPVPSHASEPLTASWQHGRPDPRRDATRRAHAASFFRACSAPWAARLPAVLCVRGAGRCFQMTRLRVWPPRSCRSVSLRWSRRPQTPSLCLLSSSGLSGGVWSPARDSVTGTQARVPHLLPPYLSRAVGLCSTSPLGCAWRSWPRDAGGRARRRSRAAQGCATSMLNLLEHTRFPAVLRISL